MTVATQAAAWDQAVRDAQGERALRLFRAQLDAYEHALDLATGAQPLDEAAIRKLHEITCAAQETYPVQTEFGRQERALPKGSYKTEPNHVLRPDGSHHAYAPVDATPSEMHRLVSELTAPRFESAHAVLQASYAHYAFVVIHPFADGNGRVARALASVYLFRRHRIPFVLYSDERDSYVAALEAADNDDHAAFVRRVFVSGRETLWAMAERLHAAGSPEALSQRLAEIVATRHGLTFTELEGVAHEVFSYVAAALGRSAQALPLPPDVKESVSGGGGTYGQRDAGYRQPLSPKILTLRLAMGPPIGTKLARQFNLLVADTVNQPFDVVLQGDRPDADLEINIDRQPPHLSVATKQRIDIWVERTLAETLKTFEDMSLRRRFELGL